MRIGLVVNPIAGMGGRVGLKGTDGKVQEARELGAEPRAPGRAVDALRALHQRAPDAAILTYAGEMGEAEAREAGFDPEVVGEPEGGADAGAGADAPDTTRADTRAAIEALVGEGVDLLLFVGGDGTAVDVAETLHDLDADVPALGVPAGVKVYSSVFAVSPGAAGRIAATSDGTEEREVVDLDEEAYREGEVRTRLHGVLRVPMAPELQSSKGMPGGSVEGLAAAIADVVEPEVTYVLGPGGTLGAIKRELGFSGSPLGVDVWRDGEVLALDASESEILSVLGDRNVIVVSPIGGQGFVLGRGNAQISPAVIRECEVRVVASRRKLDELGVLRVDTGDPELDESLRGWIRVRVGRFEERLMEVR